MAFSYTLFLVLLLLFPGLCAYAGFRASEGGDVLTPRPERPNSTATLFTVVAGTIAGHVLGAAVFPTQAWLCTWALRCATITYDPNFYRFLFAPEHPIASLTDGAILGWFVFLAAIGLVVGLLAWLLSRSETYKGWFDPIAFGWLTPAVRAVKAGRSVIVAYVVTKTQHDGASIAFEGAVQRLALDEDQRIKMIVLSRVDRFVVKIGERGVIRRIDSAGQPIAQMQFAANEIANVALEVITQSGKAP